MMRTSYCWVAQTSPRFFLRDAHFLSAVCYLSDAEQPRTPPFALKSALFLFPVTGRFQHGGIGVGVGADQGLLPESAVRSWFRLVPRWHARQTRLRGPCELPVSREPSLRVDGGVARRPLGGSMPFGSPAFLSPRSSPSSSPFSIPQNTHSTLLASLPPQDTTLASITNETDTLRSPSPPTRHSSLVVELGKTKTRYDELQRAFRDCHLALRDLSQTLQALSPSSSSSPPSSLPISALQTILARLGEFNEDARRTRDTYRGRGTHRAWVRDAARCSGRDRQRGRSARRGARRARVRRRHR